MGLCAFRTNMLHRASSMRVSAYVGVYCFLPKALKQREMLGSKGEFTTAAFLGNKPMKAEGNEASLTLKKTWGGLEMSSFSGRKCHYNPTPREYLALENHSLHKLCAPLQQETHQTPEQKESGPSSDPSPCQRQKQPVQLPLLVFTLLLKFHTDKGCTRALGKSPAFLY